MNAPWAKDRPKPQCSVDWCVRPARGHGLCGGHLQRQQKGVDLNKPWRVMGARQCKGSATCQRAGRPRNRGMCQRHYDAYLQRRRVAGDWGGLVPTDEANAHIDRLIASGMSLQRIADTAGISRVGIRKMRKAKAMWATNAEKILEIRPEVFTPSETGFVPVLGPARRLRALIALGYTRVALAEYMGMSDGTIDNIVNDRVDAVCMTIAIAIDRAFRALQLRIPPSSRASTAARNRAAKRGWHPPLAWDEDSIDDPNAQPQLAECGANFPARIADHRSLDRTDDEIAEHMGIAIGTLQQRLKRHGLPQGRRYRDIEETLSLLKHNSMSRKGLRKAS